MHDTLAVRGLQSLGNLQGEPQSVLDRKGTVLELLLQRLAFDQLHGNTLGPRLFFEPVDHRDVGVVESRQ